MKKTRCALILLLGLPLSALAADKSPDESFYKMAAEGGISEVELGQLAQEKSKSPGSARVRCHEWSRTIAPRMTSSKRYHDQGHRATHRFQRDPEGFQDEAGS